jgi:hypothetical protein
VDIEGHNTRFLRQRGRLKLFVAESATIAARLPSGYTQLCQVGYLRDGSIWIECPYLAVAQGIVAELKIPPNERSPTTYDLTSVGRFTGRPVKLSHHWSGLALFSKTAQVRSEIRREAFPLSGPIGRIFEFHVFLPHKFKHLTRLKPKRLYLDFSAGEAVPEALLVRAEWRRKQGILENTDRKGGTVGPRTTWMTKRTGLVEPVAFFGAPLAYRVSDHVLCVSCTAVPLPHNVTEPGFVLMGGYDVHERQEGEDPDAQRIHGCLLAMYPTKATDDVLARIGSIDLDLGPAA